LAKHPSVAKNARKNSDKMSAVCPHCGFTQEESVLAKSTFCRKCQEHYSLERALAGERSIVKSPSLFSKLTRLVVGDKEREVCCFACGHKQVLSTAAQSTMCPGCAAYMDLRDFKITSPFGRSVQTAGEVHVASRGDVTSTRLMCGSAFIEGSLRGCIYCTGTARIKIKGRLTGLLEAQHIVVEKGADMEFARLVRTKIFEANGKARARVVADKVIIGKTGWLEGTVYARAISVEKGGVFSGDLNIGQEEFDVAEEPMDPDRHIGRFDDDSVAFGPA
jgi:cytoskeletal protein CcmA (bactofilin family)